MASRGLFCSGFILICLANRSLSKLMIQNHRLGIRQWAFHTVLSQVPFLAVAASVGTLRFASARCCYGYEKSNLLPVTSAHALQNGFPAVACFSTTAKYFVWRSPHYASINFHFHAIFMIISLFSEVKFKDLVLSDRIKNLDIYFFVLR